MPEVMSQDRRSTLIPKKARREKGSLNFRSKVSHFQPRTRKELKFCKTSRWWLSSGWGWRWPGHEILTQKCLIDLNLKNSLSRRPEHWVWPRRRNQNWSQSGQFKRLQLVSHFKSGVRQRRISGRYRVNPKWSLRRKEKEPDIFRRKGSMGPKLVT